jgi:hypothetical protein
MKSPSICRIWFGRPLLNVRPALSLLKNRR